MYRRFAVMVVLMFVAMFALMYAMVDRLANVYILSLNQTYMAALMTGAMVIIELAVMAKMYPNRRRNRILMVVAAVLTLASWIAIRTQAGIGDGQFLRSMIPHHAGALLMCEEAPIADARIRKLCGEIRSSQEREIALMKELLANPASE